jgi:hypothetical protein
VCEDDEEGDGSIVSVVKYLSSSLIAQPLLAAFNFDQWMHDDCNMCFEHDGINPSVKLEDISKRIEIAVDDLIISSLEEGRTSHNITKHHLPVEDPVN